MLLQGRPRDRDEHGHVQQVGEGVRARGNGTGLGAERDLPLQNFGGVQRVGATPESLDGKDRARGEFIREPQQGLLHFHRVHRVLVLLARCDGADGLLWNIGCPLNQPAAHAQGGK